MIPMLILAGTVIVVALCVIISSAQSERAAAEAKARENSSNPLGRTFDPSAQPVYQGSVVDSIGPIVILLVLFGGGFYYLKNSKLIPEPQEIVLPGQVVPEQTGVASTPDKILDEYEALVNEYVPKFQHAKSRNDRAAYVALVDKLTVQVQALIERFNQSAKTINPRDFSRLQARLTLINNKYMALCQVR
ncbi:MAG: hypothetical protein Q8Q08_01815 [Candidatus Omnitrophota bacterium]|nr:hypothetical protein [Candidatus Omnitrophota bacterium]MDZ4242777.1 hypothetical protein [Candidatus Omnitrophota bacterium]